MKLRKKIRVHYSFVLLFLMAALAGYGLLMTMYFICLIFHEMAHAFVAKRLGYKIGKINLLATGAALEASSDEFTFSDEIKIAIAGPLFNLCFSLLLLALFWIFPLSFNFLQDLLVINLAIFAFNMLPSFPLDGGRVLLAFLSKKTDRKLAVKICRAVTIGLCCLLMVMFVCSCFYSVNFSLALAAVTLLFSAITADKEAVYAKTLSLFEREQRLKRRQLEVKEIVVIEPVEPLVLYKHLSPRFYTRFTILNSNLEKVKTITETEVLKLFEGENYEVGAGEKRVAGIDFKKN